ncbi:MAG TPA: UDP-glucose 4-epimerase GalE [Telluria sp.]|jgi:UDP-glucose 4-epimerase
MRVLVVGGAGYIGSHMVKMLRAHDHQVVVFDNLSGGYLDALLGAELVEADLADRAALDAVFTSRPFDAVMHFASFIQVGESVALPDKYYRNNVANTLNLLDAMVAHGVKRFIFSSTAAIFGEPEQVPIDEKQPSRPLNPYGRSKAMVEQILEDYERAFGLRYACLRYFNAAGADLDGQLGERHEPETHLIPLILQVASGYRDHIAVYGRDYPTPDGTCIRDYIHVVDLCSAHLLALQRLQHGGDSDCFNLGNGAGFSVQEVIDSARRISGQRIDVRDAPRRAGDPARLVADPSKARAVLDWNPRHAQLDTIIETAWRWECRMRQTSS